MSNRIDLGHARGRDSVSGPHGRPSTSSVAEAQAEQWMESPTPGRKSVDKGKSSEITDLETFFFEKHERKNWHINLFDDPVRPGSLPSARTAWPAACCSRGQSQDARLYRLKSPAVCMQGRWGIRVNPVSFGASVVLIWGFAVRSTRLSKHGKSVP